MGLECDYQIIVSKSLTTFLPLDNLVFIFDLFEHCLICLFQLLAVTAERSHLGICGTGSFCDCGEKFAKVSFCCFTRVTICHLIYKKSVFCSNTALFQVNIGILISVTRIISRISGENYKVHGDANAVKWGVFCLLFFYIIRLILVLLSNADIWIKIHNITILSLGLSPGWP